MDRRSGFTLIEILLVIAIIALLVAIVIRAISPGKQLADARDTERRADVRALLDATYQYAIDNNGDMPSCVTTVRKGICTFGSDCSGFDTGTEEEVVVGDGDDGADTGLGCDLDVLRDVYHVQIPVDPSGMPQDSDAYTGYDVVRQSDGRMTIFAPFAERAAIDVTR